MLMIRLQRVGRKNYAEFRIVVTEKTRAAKSSNFVELLGHYNPHTNNTVLKADRVKYWMGVGAQVSGTVFNILVDEKIIDAKKKNVLPKKTPIIKEVEEKEAPSQKKEEVAEESVKEVDSNESETSEGTEVVVDEEK